MPYTSLNPSPLERNGQGMCGEGWGPGFLLSDVSSLRYVCVGILLHVLTPAPTPPNHMCALPALGGLSPLGQVRGAADVGEPVVTVLPA